MSDKIYKDGKGRFICGRQTKGGGSCANIPGFKTPFKGQPGMPCFRHGGLSPRALSGAANFPKPGDLSFQFIDEVLKRRADEFASDSKLMDLRREVGLCRARLEKLEGSDSLETASITSSLSQTVGKLIERIHRMEMERSGLVQIGLVRLLIDSWQRAIVEVISDIDLRSILSRRMLDLSRSKLALVVEVPPSHQLSGIKVKKESAKDEKISEMDSESVQVQIKQGII